MPFSFPYCEGSLVGVIFFIMASAKNFSKSLEKFRVPEIFLRLFGVFGGYFLGAGVTVSIFHMSGYSPALQHLLKISDRGNDNSYANFFITFTMISPATVAELLLIFFNFWLTKNGSIQGKDFVYSIRLCHIECRLTVTETYLSDHACIQYGDCTINTTKMNESDDFKRLHQAGKEANLVLNTLAGSAWATLSVCIGPGGPGQHTHQQKAQGARNGPAQQSRYEK